MVERLQGKIKKQTDPAVEHKKCIAERFLNLLGRARNGGGVGHAPMRRHRLAGPDRADFFGRVVADREYEIELGCSRLCKLIPALASHSRCGNVGRLKLAQSFGPYLARWIASGAVSGEGRLAFFGS